MDEVLALWSGFFGFQIYVQKEGEDPDLARFWGLSPKDIKRQALLGTPGANTGKVHFVEFNRPGPAVRDGADNFALCAKNLDVYAHDLPARVEELQAAGYHFNHQKCNEVTAPDGTVFREITLYGHDEINIVLLELVGMELPFTPQGYAGIGPVVGNVADAGTEREFFRDVIGMNVLYDSVLEGPELEHTFGLPPGSALSYSIWGDAGVAFGRVQIVNFRGVDGKNLYPAAIPKQRGILQTSYVEADLPRLIRILREAGVEWSEAGELSALPGSGRFIRFHSPAGLQINVFEQKG